MSHPCTNCGFDRWEALDFHHTDPSTKREGGVSKLVSRGYTLPVIQAEMDKCIVLCSNCHRILHAEEGK